LTRAFEWVYLAYFGYVFLLSLAMRPAIALYTGVIAALMATLILALARFSRGNIFPALRDWLPLAYTLIAYREMDLFAEPHPGNPLEHSWIVWDRLLLDQWGLRRAIESTGFIVPGYLELCYLLIYVTGAFSIAIFYFHNRRERVEPFLVYFSLGTVLSYALFPFFPSDPPRVVFAGEDLPVVATSLRTINLYLVGNYGIHSSVFPSAHVSCAWASAWGLLHLLPERRIMGIAMLVYAASVSVATVYGRYHYAVDAAAGILVGFIPVIVVSMAGLRRNPSTRQSV